MRKAPLLPKAVEFQQVPGRRFGVVMLLLVAVSFMIPPLPGLAQSTEKGDVYSKEIPPMSPSECGSCHPKQYGDLRDSGGGHKMACQVCHEIFHALNPRKDNFAELMPECADCHDAIHGEKGIGGCLSCHENAHAPGLIPLPGQLAGVCRVCHPLPAKELEKKSGHHGQNCIDCHHTEHGFIPDCSDCHTPHYPSQETGGCFICHPPHLPNDLKFFIDSDSRNCHSCHQNIYTKWSRTGSAHGDLDCTFCHATHGHRPGCGDCHGNPHGSPVTSGFRTCLGCHLDAHDLPRKIRR